MTESQLKLKVLGSMPSEKRSAENKEEDAKKGKYEEAAYLALPIVPSIVSHGAEKHMAWVLKNIPNTKQVGEAFKDKDGHLMHAVVAISNKNAQTHIYFGDAMCTKHHMKDGDLVGGVHLHMNLDAADKAKEAWDNVEGGTVLEDFTPAFWGAMFGLVKDPFGYVWAFCSPLPEKAAE